MPWSVIIAEPLGTVAGFALGEYAGRFAKQVSQTFELNDDIATFLTTTTAHFFATATTKAVANVACGDPIGLSINPVTSLVTATAHGIGRVAADRLRDEATEGKIA